MEGGGGGGSVVKEMVWVSGGFLQISGHMRVEGGLINLVLPPIGGRCWNFIHTLDPSVDWWY